VIVVTELASAAERRVRMIVDVPPNTFRAPVVFPRAGLYEVAVIGFDPRDPARSADIGPRVRIEPARQPARAAANGGFASWPRALLVATAIVTLLASAWSIQRVRARSTA
jgi:hypothetical protein